MEHKALQAGVDNKKTKIMGSNKQNMKMYLMRGPRGLE